MAAIAAAAPSGHGVVVSGPSGVVTDHGAVGPAGHGHGWDDGHWDDGSWDDGSWGGHWGGGWDDGHWGAHSNVVHGNGATLVGPSAGHAAVVGPSVGHGHGGWGGHGVVVGHGGWGGHGHGHGVVVAGPPTVPATIVGPAGKVHADGLWGPTHVHGGHGHHW